MGISGVRTLIHSVVCAGALAMTMTLAACTTVSTGPSSGAFVERSVTVDGKAVALTATEFDLLALLMREAGRVVTKERISQAVLGRPLGPYDRSIDVHVSNLRRKLGTAADGQSHITTIHRSGYLFRKLDEH